MANWFSEQLTCRRNNTAVTVSSGGGNITFDGTIDGAQALTVNAGSGTTDFNAAVGSLAALSTLDVSGTGAIGLDGNITTANTNATLNGPVMLLGTNSTINTGSGTLTFGSTINGDYNLNATAATMSFGGAIGGSTALNNVTLNSTNSLTLPSITAASVSATTTDANAGITIAGAQTTSGDFYANAIGNLTLNNGATVTSSASGNAIVVAAGGNFINNSGFSTPFTASSGRFIGYSDNPADDTDPLAAAQTIYHETDGTLPPSNITSANGYSATQNTWVYAIGIITITANNQIITYGTVPTLTYSFSCTGGCSQSVMSGALSTNATLSGSGYDNAGSWSILKGTLADSNGYTINFTPGIFTVTPKTLTITGMVAGNKRYDGTTTATLDNSGDQLSGLVSGDSVSFTASTTGSFADAAIGNNKLVTASGFSLFGPDAGDYSLIQPTALANILSVGEEVAGSGIDITILTNPFFCNAGNEDSRNAPCTTATLATHPAPIHIFYNIPTNLMLVHEELPNYGDDPGLR